jgi:hypothetical protein
VYFISNEDSLSHARVLNWRWVALAAGYHVTLDSSFHFFFQQMKDILKGGVQFDLLDKMNKFVVNLKCVESSHWAFRIDFESWGIEKQGSKHLNGIFYLGSHHLSSLLIADQNKSKVVVLRLFHLVFLKVVKLFIFNRY